MLRPELGFPTAKFSSCLDSGMDTMQRRSNIAEGRKYGVSAAPTFFVNGRMLSGAAPYQNFASMIDEELHRAASTKAN